MSNAEVPRCCQSTPRSTASNPMDYLSHQMKQPLAIRILSWFAALASAGMFVSIALAILDIGPDLMGGEKVTRSEWLHIAAPLVAMIGCLMASIAWSCRAQSVVAPSRDGDICADNRVCVRARRTECTSAHDYVACHR